MYNCGYRLWDKSRTNGNYYDRRRIKDSNQKEILSEQFARFEIDRFLFQGKYDIDDESSLREMLLKDIFKITLLSMHSETFKIKRRNADA